MLDAYAAGVNAFLATTTALPIEYQLLDQCPEPWESWHCLAVYKVRNSLLGTFEPKLWRTRLAQVVGPENLAQLIKGYPQGHLLTVPPGTEYQGDPLDGLAALSRRETDPGSNAWAIAGAYTDSGLPLVAGDSHRALDTPSVYYQIHLVCPDFAVIGYSVPGVPGTLHFCHNEYVAWGMTYGSADTQDLFVEHFREMADGLEYEFRGAWRPAQILREEIHVRGAASAACEIVINPSRAYRRRPIRAKAKPSPSATRASLKAPLGSTTPPAMPCAPAQSRACTKPLPAGPTASTTMPSPTSTAASAIYTRVGSRCERPQTAGAPSPAGPANTSGEATSPTPSCPKP